MYWNWRYQRRYTNQTTSFYIHSCLCHHMASLHIQTLVGICRRRRHSVYTNGPGTGFGFPLASSFLWHFFHRLYHRHTIFFPVCTTFVDATVPERSAKSKTRRLFTFMPLPIFTTMVYSNWVWRRHVLSINILFTSLSTYINISCWLAG